MMEESTEMLLLYCQNVPNLTVSLTKNNLKILTCNIFNILQSCILDKKKKKKWNHVIVLPSSFAFTRNNFDDKGMKMAEKFNFKLIATIKSKKKTS